MERLVPSAAALGVRTRISSPPADRTRRNAHVQRRPPGCSHRDDPPQRWIRGRRGNGVRRAGGGARCNRLWMHRPTRALSSVTRP